MNPSPPEPAGWLSMPTLARIIGWEPPAFVVRWEPIPSVSPWDVEATMPTVGEALERELPTPARATGAWVGAALPEWTPWAGWQGPSLGGLGSWVIVALAAAAFAYGYGTSAGRSRGR